MGRKIAALPDEIAALRQQMLALQAQMKAPDRQVSGMKVPTPHPSAHTLPGH